MKRLLCVVLFLIPSPLLAGEISAVGQFLKSAENSEINMEEVTKGGNRGWQTSGLTYDAQTAIWWSICDKKGSTSSKTKKHAARFMYRLSRNKKTNQFHAKPYKIWWLNKSQFQKILKLSGTKNLDFEALAADPRTKNTFYAVTEGENPCLVKIKFYEKGVKRDGIKERVYLEVTQSTTLDLDEKYHNDINRRWEGLAVSPNGNALYLAIEWAQAKYRIYKVSMEKFEATKWVKKKVLNKVEMIPPEVKLESLAGTSFLAGEVSGLSFLKHKKKEYLLVLERNPDREKTKPKPKELPKTKSPSKIYLTRVEGDRLKEVGCVVLDFKAPSGAQPIDIVSPSPEGIATDGTKILLLGDPDIRFYQAIKGAQTPNEMKKLVPLIFDLKVSDILKKAGAN